MIETLNKYLIQHKSINIPGLGTIFIEHRPAILDVVNKRMLPPHYEFRFNKYFDTPDKEFFNYLSYEKGIPDYEAIQLYNQFAQELRTAIKQEEKAEWQDVGVFMKNSSGDIIFESQGSLHSLYAPVAATRVVREMASHAVLVGDHETTTDQISSLLNEATPDTKKPAWWLFALIVLFISFLFIAFHFYQNGFNITSLGNSASVGVQ